MPTRPRKTAELILADARHVLIGAKKNAAKLKSAEKGRKAKFFPGGVDAFLAGLAASIRAGEKSIGAQTVNAQKIKRATAVEKEARAALYGALIAIRDDVALTHANDKVLGEAFGVGQRLTVHSTPRLLGAAASVLEACADPTIKQAAVAAGVTPARIRECVRLRDALAAADATQNAAMAARKGGTLGKYDVLGTIEHDVAHLRAVAKHVLRADAKALAVFQRTVPRRTAKKRAKPAAPAATPAP